MTEVRVSKNRDLLRQHHNLLWWEREWLNHAVLASSEASCFLLYQRYKAKKKKEGYPTSHVSLPASRFSFPTSHLSLPTSRFSFPTSHLSLLTSRFSFPTSHLSLLTSRFSFPTSHLLLLTSHFSPPASHPVRVAEGNCLGITVIQKSHLK